MKYSVSEVSEHVYIKDRDLPRVPVEIFRKKCNFVSSSQILSRQVIWRAERLGKGTNPSLPFLPVVEFTSAESCLGSSHPDSRINIAL